MAYVSKGKGGDTTVYFKDSAGVCLEPALLLATVIVGNRNHIDTETSSFDLIGDDAIGNLVANTPPQESFENEASNLMAFFAKNL